MGREYMGVLRSTFVIDKQGGIVMVMEKVKTKTHHQDVLYWIKENLNSGERIITANKPEGTNLIDVKIYQFDEKFLLRV